MLGEDRRLLDIFIAFGSSERSLAPSRLVFSMTNEKWKIMENDIWKMFCLLSAHCLLPTVYLINGSPT